MEALQSTVSAAGAIQRVKYTHDAMIDLIIAKPYISQNEIAAYFGYTASWISRITCSDSFQARLAARRTEIINPELVLNFEERLKGLATQSLDLLTKKLEAVDEVTGEPTVNVDVMFKALEISTKCLGYGARQTNVAIQNNVTVAQMSDSELLKIANG